MGFQCSRCSALPVSLMLKPPLYLDRSWQNKFPLEFKNWFQLMWLSLPNAFPEKDPAQVKLNSKIENRKKQFRFKSEKIFFASSLPTSSAAASARIEISCNEMLLKFEIRNVFNHCYRQQLQLQQLPLKSSLIECLRNGLLLCSLINTSDD